MPTPRPLGVRRANDSEEQIVQHVTSLPADRPFDPKWGSGFGALSARLTHIALALQTL